MNEEDLTLRMMRLKKMRRMMIEASKKTSIEPEKAQEESATNKLLKHLTDRGDEVLEAARSLNPKLTERVAEVLLKAIAEEKIRAPITGGELLHLFRRLGLDVKVDTKVAVYKKGETRELRDFLEESWRELG